MEFRELVRHLSEHPGMHVNPPTLDSVCVYLCEYDLARDGGPLCGFREWLIVRADKGNNLHWVGLVHLLRQRDADSAVKQSEEKQIEDLGKLILDYLDYRTSKGLASVFNDYREWFVNQEWYDESRR